MCVVAIDAPDVVNVALQQAHVHSCYSQYNICQLQLNKNVVNCSSAKKKVINCNGANKSCQL